MNFIIVSLSCLVVFVHQVHSIGYGGEIGHGHAYSHQTIHQSTQGGGGGGHYEHYPHHFPEYKYDYAVKDFHTGDNKKAWEHRHGDVVKGGYTLKEADGTTRVVEYQSDKLNGFNAIVKQLGHAEHPKIYGKYGGGYGEQSGGQGGEGGFF